MSRYYFNLIGEHSVDDFDGLDLADEATVNFQASAPPPGPEFLSKPV